MSAASHKLLSVLVCGVPQRYGIQADDLLSELFSQLERLDNNSVEIIYVLDNCARSVGRKRADLIGMAQGDFVAFIDDDDRIEDNYLDTLTKAITAYPQADVICFRQLCHHLETSEIGIAGRDVLCEYSLTFEYNETDELTLDGKPSGRRLWSGKPAHTMAWASRIAKACTFPDGDFGEDVAWVKQACALAQKEVQIPQVLYHYNFRASTSMTRLEKNP